MANYPSGELFTINFYICFIFNEKSLHKPVENFQTMSPPSSVRQVDTVAQLLLSLSRLAQGIPQSLLMQSGYTHYTPNTTMYPFTIQSLSKDNHI